jgi:hypothetical protein
MRRYNSGEKQTNFLPVFVYQLVGSEVQFSALCLKPNGFQKLKKTLCFRKKT